MGDFETGARKKFVVPENEPAAAVEDPKVMHVQAPEYQEPKEQTVAVSDDSVELQNVSVAPAFTVVDVDHSDIKAFAREYTPTLEMLSCVADVNMLLTYMVSTERRLGVTLSLRAYGVDPVVFEEASRDTPDGEPKVVFIKVPEKSSVDGYEGDIYELIDVDGVLYLSCVSESLNPDYLHQVIAEATEAVFTHGKYVYTLVGPRPLLMGEDNRQWFTNTLKLNSYELSVLLSYMGGIDGIKITHGVYGNCAAILFER